MPPLLLKGRQYLSTSTVA